jgi:chromosome segregation ATPase
MEAKEKEGAELIELITNLNSIVLHLKTQSSAAKADVASSKADAARLSGELDHLQSQYNDLSTREGDARRLCEVLQTSLSSSQRELEEVKAVLSLPLPFLRTGQG